MSSAYHRAQLKVFLKARRAAVEPESVGLTRGNRRILRGLRREELAALAGVGLTWYTWLEQGREITPSAAVLRRLALALRLSDADEAYLFALVGLPRSERAPPPFQMSAALSGVLQAYQGPAAVLDPMFEHLASNRLAARLFDFDASVPPFDGNQLWQLFCNARRRALYLDLPRSMRNFVALFRLSSVSRIGRPDYERLISALSDNQDFAAIWNERQVAAPSPLAVEMVHQEFGPISINSLRLPLEGSEGAMLIFLAPADQATAASFARVAAMAQENAPEPAYQGPK